MGEERENSNLVVLLAPHLWTLRYNVVLPTTCNPD